MAIISVGALSKSFGENTLFENVSFSVSEGDKIGFIGGNGAGKTTLFKIICGEEFKDSGTLSVSSQIKISYMQQFPLKDSEKTVFDEALEVFSYLEEIEEEEKAVTEKIALGLDIPKYIDLQHDLRLRFENLGGLTYKSRTRSMLMGLGFSESDLTLPVSALSGGEKTRVSLAKMLLSESDLLLLDEPTNHLDMESVAFLEDFLSSVKAAFIVISHDRYFLDKVTTKTMELENKTLKLFDAPYSKYLQFKETDREITLKHYENDLREIKRIEGIIEQQRRWNREKNIRTAESKQKKIDKMLQSLKKPEQLAKDVSISFSAKVQSGFDVLKAECLSKSFDNQQLFENVSFDIKRGDRAFIIGGNGTGKSTIFNIITKRIKADSGTYSIGTKVDIGYFDQHSSDLLASNTIISEIRNAHPHMTDTEIRCALAGFLFFGDDVFKEISTLSGGERARVALLKLMLSGHNLLLLDEPTNHLDIKSREALEDALLSYDGTVLAISHDRYFINKIASRIYALSENGATLYEGNFDYYKEKKSSFSVKKEEKAPKRENSYEVQKAQRAQLKKLERNLKKCEDDIALSEEELKTLEEELSKVQSDYVKAMEISAKAEEIKTKLSSLYSLWEELSIALEAEIT